MILSIFKDSGNQKKHKNLIIQKRYVLDYNTLADIEREESLSTSLSKLPDGFYSHVNSLLSSLELKIKELYDEDREIKEREYRNTKKLYKRIIERRLSKIFLMVSRGIKPSNLSVEEEVLVEHLLKSRDEFMSIISGVKTKNEPIKVDEKKESILSSFTEKDGERKDGKAPSIDDKEDDKKSNVKKDMENKKQIKVIKYIEEYRGIDGNIYGPYRVGDIVELPNEEAEWLIKNGFGEPLD